MKWFLKVLSGVSAVYVIILIVLNSAAGMEPIWAIITIAAFTLSMDKPYKILFSSKLFIVIIIATGVLFLIVESTILVNGFKTDSDHKADYIIVLGAGVRGETPSLTLSKRLEKAYEYLYKNHEVVAILSGGQGSGENITEAEAMRRYLIGKGISKERLLLENQSTSTEENIINSFEIINKYNKDAKVIIITSRFHILRSKMLAKDNGKKVEGIGANTMEFLIPNYYLREFFAVIKEIIA